MSGVIAIVGRPNVGKSALFNRIVGKRIAIVHDQPGVTRDRISAEAEWRGRPFTLIDTGGIGLLRGEKAKDVIIEAALEQVEVALDAAHAIILVVNVQEGIVPLDRDVAARLHSSEKPVFLAINKADNDRFQNDSSEFSELGFEHVYPVSAIHGYGIESLIDAAFSALPSANQPPQIDDSRSEAQFVDGTARISEPLKLAIVGRPNVGKSSIVNALTGSERVIVSPIPGTTRDAVDIPFDVQTEGVLEKYVLIDTAGVRQQRRIDNSIEFYSVKRTEDSIQRSDITIFVLDAEAGITAQDKKVADKIVESRKACIIVVNKWDLVAESVTQARKDEIVRRQEKIKVQNRERMTTLAEFASWVQKHLFFLSYAPVIFTSAQSGFHLERLLEAVRFVAAQLQQKIPTALLNRTLNDAIERRQPVSAMGHRLKFFYATQVGQAPPKFLLFVNRDELFSEQYKKYLMNELRRAFGFEGCPLILIAKPRPKTILPKKKSSKLVRRS
jgi:GTPase